MSISARNRRRARLAALTSSATLLAACAVGPDFRRPDAHPPQAYVQGGNPSATRSADNVAQHFSEGATVNAQWWHELRAPKLDAVVEAALAGNPGLEAAQASLRAAQDQLRAGYGVFFPQLGTDFGATREKYSPIKVGEPGSGSVFNLYSLSGTVSYTLDIFGGERRMVEALGAEKDVASANERATYVALTANVADTVIARAAYRAQIAATDELIAVETDQVALARVQARAGTVPYSNVLSLESTLAATEATLPPLAQKAAQADDLLATLAGHAPADWHAPDLDLADLTLPQDLPLSVPSRLLEQRPDILAAEATAHSASANIGVATAAMLPQITLGGSGSYNATQMGQLFAAGGGLWSVGADVAQPIFEGGSLWFRRKAAIEDYRQAAALYRQTVLSAFGQVADTLAALDHDAQALAAEERALATAREALHLVQSNYKAGLVTYLDVITADVQFHQAELGEIGARATRLQDTVALYVALGGGRQDGKTASR